MKFQVFFMVMCTVAAFGDWLAGWIPFGTMPLNEKEVFIQEIAEAYQVESGGTVCFLMDELLIQSTKI